MATGAHGMVNDDVCSCRLRGLLLWRSAVCLIVHYVISTLTWAD